MSSGMAPEMAPEMAQQFMPKIIRPPEGTFSQSVFQEVGLDIPAEDVDYLKEKHSDSPVSPLDKSRLDHSNWSSTTLTRDDEQESAPSYYSQEEERKLEKAAPQQIIYPSMGRTYMIIATVIIIICLTALDATILSTVTPKLVQIWGNAADMGWYGSVYLLPQPVLQPLFGKLYPYLNTKYCLLFGLFLFEMGSLIAGLSNSPIMFIFGRLTAGIGASMVTPGISLVITDIVPRDKRPILTGIAAMIGGTAACLGPIIGGIFVTHISWRWSFYINLPFGFAAGVLFFFLYQPIPREIRNVSWWIVLCRLDPLGCTLLMSTVLTLLLAFTFAAQGGWGSAPVIALLIFSATHLIAFIIEQTSRPAEYALLPPKILKKKAICLCALFGFCVEAASTLHSYFLPTYFQAVQQKSAQASGVATLPQLLAQTFAGLAVGILINFNGRFKPPMVIGTAIFAVGSGLLLTLKDDTNSSQLIGYQILSGFGTGMCMFMAMGIAQQKLERDEESIGLSMVYMVKTLGSTISISLGSTIFNSKLYSELASDNLPADAITNVFGLIAGAGNGGVVNDKIEPLIGKAVTDAIDQVFLIPLVMGMVAFIIAIVIEKVHVVKTPKAEAGQAGPQQQEEEEEEQGLAAEDVPEEVRLQRAESMKRRAKESNEFYEDGIYGNEM